MIKHLRRKYGRGAEYSDAERSDEKDVQHNSMVEGERGQRRGAVAKETKRSKGGRLAAMKGRLRR